MAMDVKEAKARRKAALETPTNLGSNATRDISGALNATSVAPSAGDVIVIVGAPDSVVVKDQFTVVGPLPRVSQASTVTFITVFSG